MKILIVGPAWPYRGGIADFDERIAREYIKKGDEVETLLSSSPAKRSILQTRAPNTLT